MFIRHRKCEGEKCQAFFFSFNAPDVFNEITVKWIDPDHNAGKSKTSNSGMNTILDLEGSNSKSLHVQAVCILRFFFDLFDLTTIHLLGLQFLPSWNMSQHPLAMPKHHSSVIVMWRYCILWRCNHEVWANSSVFTASNRQSNIIPQKKLRNELITSRAIPKITYWTSRQCGCELIHENRVSEPSLKSCFVGSSIPIVLAKTHLCWNRSAEILSAVSHSFIQIFQRRIFFHGKQQNMCLCFHQ